MLLAVLGVLCGGWCHPAWSEPLPPRPIPSAHAHNDYAHSRPLLDALEEGFCSIEADVYRVGDELWVAHDRRDLAPERTLERLYLEPLAQRVAANQGRVYPNGPTLTLLVDFKSEADTTWQALQPLLQRHAGILERDVAGIRQPGAIRVVISGNRPTAVITADPNRLAFIDGRPSDLDASEPTPWLPLISERWGTHFTWAGVGELPPEELQQLETMIHKAHARGQQLRFWAIPDVPAAWKTLSDAGVDLINTDRLTDFSQWYWQRQQPLVE